jgi:carbon storage regulator CsrA
MLVLSRKSNESIVVGGNDGLPPVLKITVLEIMGNRVRLGFEGDPDLAVNRLEIWARRNGASPTAEPAAETPASGERAPSARMSGARAAQG